MNNLDQQIAALEQKIQDIDAEREALFQKLLKLKNQQPPSGRKPESTHS